MVYSPVNSIAATNAANTLQTTANAQIAAVRNVNSNTDIKAAFEKDKMLESQKLKSELEYKANLAADESQKKLQKEKAKHKLYLLA